MAPVDYTPPANPHMLHNPAQQDQAQGRPWKSYTVRPGDTLAKLAVRHHVSIKALVAKNKITNPRVIEVGRTLQVPGPAPTRSAAPAPQAKTAAKAASRSAAAKKPVRTVRTHVVRPGENLITLGIRYQVGWSALMKANHLSDPNSLPVGKTLKVPVPSGWTPNAGKHPSKAPKATAPKAKPGTTKPVAHTPAPKPKPAPARTHVVRPGDNLITLGIRYQVGWSALMKANHLSDPNSLSVGMKLKVPAPNGWSPSAKAPRGTKATPPKAGKPKPGTPSRDATRPSTGKPKTPRTDNDGPTTLPKGKGKTSKSTKDNTFAGRTYPDHVVNSARTNRERLRHVDVPSRSQTRDMIVATARRYGVDPRLALAIGWQESGWNQRAVSVANAVGVMQVMPSTGTWCSELAGRKLNLMNPQDNITAGIVYLRYLTTHASSRDQAIAGYYQGLGGVRKYGMYPDTRVYVRSVKSHMARF